ncbi:hypothetical protein I8752_07380 [Nostocaceae cyanobacterium CENA369]|uniref:Uncharacterized protein n=1 Tax=Dendronalium phyllosphericum CENA369 TaxID=1725256 RepID=A0A8J7I4J3_9NOST|nr:hypothetical protein [Dendronalium phyllosphericum]MBH8572841.1 hypothetical protein [Dendronalium phyllosphericum CENA369]
MLIAQALKNWISTQHSTLSTQHSALSTQHSTLSTQHSTLSTLLSEQVMLWFSLYIWEL